MKYLNDIDIEIIEENLIDRVNYLALALEIFPKDDKYEYGSLYNQFDSRLELLEFIFGEHIIKKIGNDKLKNLTNNGV